MTFQVSADEGMGKSEIFNDEIKQVLAKIGFENKLCFLFGDFNVNILNADSHVPSNDLIDLMYSNGFYPLISKPTRITSHSATLIDNIFSNDLDNHKFSGILWSDISDHLPIFQITNCSLKSKTKSSVYHKRLAPCKGIQDILGFWIPRCGFRIPGTGFRIPAQWIPDSKKLWISIFYFF